MCTNVVLNEVYLNENDNFSNFYDFWYHILTSTNNYCFMTYIISYEIENKSYNSPIYGIDLKNKKSLDSFNYDINDDTLNLFKKLYEGNKEIFFTLPEFDNFKLFKHFKYLLKKIMTIRKTDIKENCYEKSIKNELKSLETNLKITKDLEDELLVKNPLENENFYVKYTKKYNENLDKNKNYLIENKEDFLHLVVTCYIENIEINNLNLNLKFDNISFNNWFYITKSFIISIIDINHLIISEALYCYYNKENYKEMLINFNYLDKEDKENICKSFNYKNPLASFINYLWKKYCKKFDREKERKKIHLNNLCKIMYNIF